MFLILWVASGIYRMIPFIGWLTGWILMLGLFILWVVAIIKILSGEKWLIPVVGEIADKWDL